MCVCVCVWIRICYIPSMCVMCVGRCLYTFAGKSCVADEVRALGEREAAQLQAAVSSSYVALKGEASHSPTHGLLG